MNLTGSGYRSNAPSYKHVKYVSNQPVNSTEQIPCWEANRFILASWYGINRIVRDQESDAVLKNTVTSPHIQPDKSRIHPAIKSIPVPAQMLLCLSDSLFRISTRALYSLLCSVMLITCPAHSILFDIVIPASNIDEVCWWWCFSLFSSLISDLTSSHSSTNIPLSTAFSDILCLHYTASSPSTKWWNFLTSWERDKAFTLVYARTMVIIIMAKHFYFFNISLF